MLRPEAEASLELRDGILVSADEDASDYRRQWEAEAEADHVVAAIARRGDESLESLTAKLTPVWERIPAGSTFGTILDVGCGYGRVGLHLSTARGIRCERFVGVNISEAMLRHLRRYLERFGVFPGAEVVLLRGSADTLPLLDESVDLVLSSAVFLHMGRRYAEATARELARVLRPGGSIVLEASFPNRLCPANVVTRLSRLAGERRPNQVKLWTRDEVEALVERSGIARKLDGAYRVEAVERALLPKSVAGRSVPLARRLNRLVDERRLGPERLLGTTFTVTSF